LDIHTYKHIYVIYIHRCINVDAQTHTNIHSSSSVSIVSLYLWRMLAAVSLYLYLWSFSYVSSPSFSLSFFAPPSFAGKQSNQRFVCLLFLFCFCSPSVRRCACVCDCVLVNLFSILPVTCWPFSLHLIRSSSSSSSTSSSSLSSFVISLCLFVGSPGSERATKTNET